MGATHWALVAAVGVAGLLVAGCGGAPGQCGAPYVVGVYDDPGPYEVGGGWYYPGDDGTGAYTGDDGTGDDTSGDDGTGDGTDPSAGDTSGSSGDDSTSTSGDDTSGSTGDDSSGSSGDDSSSSGDDGSGCIEPGHFARHRKHHRARRHEGGAPAAAATAAMRVQTAPAPATVLGAGQDSCYSCTLSCVLAAPAAGRANAATAIGGSDASFAAACSNAQSELAKWAVNQGSSLQACRVGAAPVATQSAPPPSASTSAPSLVGPIVHHRLSAPAAPTPSGGGVVLPR